MFLALLIVAFLIYLVHQSNFGMEINSSLGFWWLLASMAVLLVQILLGTQVREAIDQVAAVASREAWIRNLGERVHYPPFFLVDRAYPSRGINCEIAQNSGVKIFRAYPNRANFGDNFNWAWNGLFWCSSLSSASAFIARYCNIWYAVLVLAEAKQKRRTRTSIT